MSGYIDWLESCLDEAVESDELTDREAWLEYNLALYEGRYGEGED